LIIIADRRKMTRHVVVSYLALVPTDARWNGHRQDPGPGSADIQANAARSTI
jgi:hypothetical protein